MLVVGKTVVLPLRTTKPMPPIWTLVAFVLDQKSVVGLPEVIVVGFAEMLHVGA